MNPVRETIAICAKEEPFRLFATRMRALPREKCALLDPPPRL